MFLRVTSALASSVLFTDYQCMTNIDTSSSSVLVLESFVLAGREKGNIWPIIQCLGPFIKYSGNISPDKKYDILVNNITGHKS